MSVYVFRYLNLHEKRPRKKAEQVVKKATAAFQNINPQFDTV